MYASFIRMCIGLTYFGFKTFMFYYKNVLKGIVLLLHVVKWPFSFGCSHTIRSDMPIVSKKSLSFFLIMHCSYETLVLQHVLNNVL